MHRLLTWIACVVVLLAFAASTGFGADDQANGGGEHKDPKFTGEVHEGGKFVERKYDLANDADKKQLLADLPHLHELHKDEPPDIFGLKRWDLGLWSIVIFLALFFVLKKFAWKPMVDGLHKREENIRSALEQAEATRREAMNLQAKLDAQLKEAGGRIAAMMDEARRDATALKDQMVTEAKAEIQHERDRLKRELATQTDQALLELSQHAIGLASLMSSKAIRRSLSADDHRRLLDESLAELKQAGAGFGKRKLSGAGL